MVKEVIPASYTDELDALQGGLFAGTVVPVTGATLTSLASGTTYVLDRAGGIDVTLPAATGSGDHFHFFVRTSVTDDHTWTATTPDLLIGTVFMVDTDSSNAVTGYSPDGTDDLVITLNGDTSGGLVGSWIEVRDIAADRWFVRGVSRHSGNVSSPFS